MTDEMTDDIEVSMVGAFDFDSILEDNELEVVNPTHSQTVEDDSDEEYEYEDEDEFEDEEEDDELASEDKLTSFQDFAEQFDDLPDDLTFKMGDASFTKADIVSTVKAKAEVDEAHEAFTSFIENLNNINQRQEMYVRGSMSETEMKLAEIEEVLANPGNVAPSKLQAMLEAKHAYEQRHKVLEQNLVKVIEDNKIRKDAANVAKIRQTDLMMRGTPGYAGMSTLQELAQWAQKEGISGDAVVEGMAPALIKILMDAKKYREDTVSRKERVKKAVSTPTSVSSKKKAVAPKVRDTAAKARAVKALEKGDLSSAFEFIED